jgi:hypothetical protein
LPALRFVADRESERRPGPSRRNRPVQTARCGAPPT